MAIGLYIRISHDPLGIRAGVERQLSDCQQIAQQRWPGEELVIFEDNDRSAYRGKRPAFQELLEALKTRLVTGLIGWDLDRLFRQPRELEAFIDLCGTHQITRVLTAKGDLDLTTHDGQLQARILVAVARKESDDKSRRVTRAARDRAESGRWHGGQPPYGYLLIDHQLTVDPTAAARVLAAARSIANGGTLADITRLGCGPTSVVGWRKLLQSPSITSLTRLHADGNWQPIVPRDIWLQVQQVLESRTGRSVSAHWLTYVLVCGVCGDKVRAHRRNIYQCPKSHVAVKRDIIEGYVEGQFFNHRVVDRVDAAVDVTQPSTADTKLVQLALDYANNLITRAEWLAIRDHLMQPTRVSVASAVPYELSAWWCDPARTQPERAHMARRLAERVVLAPYVRGAALEDRVQIHWR